MDNSLSPLHALGKFPEINRSYLPAVVFTIFNLFLLLFQYKIDYNFTIDFEWRTGLKWWPWTSTIEDCHVFVAWIRLIQNECEPYNIKFFVDTLVLIWVSLQAANCAWPWLSIISKKGAYHGTSSPSAFLLMFVLERRYRLDMIGQLTS